MSITTLPDADRIEGLSYVPAADVRLARFELQYKTHTGQLCEAHFDALNGLYLLNLLEQAAKDAGIEHLRRPPPGR